MAADVIPTPSGYEDIPVPCPACGEALDVGLVDVTSLGKLPGTEYVLGQLTCPTSRLHDLRDAYRAMELVAIGHEDRPDRGRCTLGRLDHWRTLGWYPLDGEHQTPTEMVHARVRELTLAALDTP